MIYGYLYVFKKANKQKYFKCNDKNKKLYLNKKVSYN